MKNIKILATAILLTTFFASCVYTKPSDDISPIGQEEDIYSVSNFNSISFGHAFHAEVIPSNEFKVTINGDARDLEDIRVRVSNKTLIIDYGTTGWFNRKNRDRVNLLIEVPHLSSADISGAAYVQIDGFEVFPSFSLDLSGASVINLNVPVEEFNMDLSGASRLQVLQESKVIRADLSGASNLDAYDANSEKVYLELSGASRANVRVSDYLFVDASGASSVSYKGNPSIDQEISGGSKIVKK